MLLVLKQGLLSGLTENMEIFEGISIVLPVWAPGTF